MSSTVRGNGFIAMLANPITDQEAHENICERLWEESGEITLNYEGTLVIFDEYRKRSLADREDIYHLTVGDASAGDRQKFIDLAAKFDLVIKLDSILPWSAIWYTGCDSPQSLLTLTEFTQNLPKV